MSIFSLIITLAVFGLLLWAVNAIIPMEPTIKKIINVVAIVAVVLWLLGGFGVLPAGNIHWTR